MLVFVTWPASVFASPPSNDNRANRLRLTAPTSTVVGSNADATVEAGEPVALAAGSFRKLSSLGASVWYSDAPVADGKVHIDTCRLTRFLTRSVAVP